MSRPLRVLQVSARYLPDLGGIETHMAEVTRRLAEREDLDVEILTTDRSGRLPRHETTPDGVPVRRVRAWPRERDYYVAPGLVRPIRSGDWDVVHVQGIHTAAPIAAMAAARSAGIPYVVTFHTGGHSSATRNAARGLQWRALTPLLRGAAHLIAVGRFERTAFAEVTGIPAERFSVIRNGGSLPVVPDGVVAVPGLIVSAGRLEQYKGHHRAIQALPLVRERVPGARLQIYGAGPYESELRALAARLGVQDHVGIEFLPPTERGAMARGLKQASVLAAFSDYEAHPVTVVEALTLGVPVVGTAVAGIGDLVEDGLVRGVPPEATPEVTAAALVEALTAPAPVARPVLPTWEEAADALAEVYRAVSYRPVGVRPGV